METTNSGTPNLNLPSTAYEISIQKAALEIILSMLHEIGNHVNGIVGNGRILKMVQDAGNYDQVSMLLSNVIQSVENLDEVWMRLKTCAQDGEIYKMRETIFPIDQLLKQVQSATEALFIAKGISLQKTVDPFFPALIRGDKTYLLQIVTNLLINAAKYSPINKNVSITITKQSDFFSIIVEDQGYGIPEEKIETLFDRGVSNNDTQDTYLGGIGYGLYIVKELTNLLGGIIAVKSKVGEGSRFTVTLPFLRLF